MHGSLLPGSPREPEAACVGEEDAGQASGCHSWDKGKEGRGRQRLIPRNASEAAFWFSHPEPLSAPGPGGLHPALAPLKAAPPRCSLRGLQSPCPTLPSCTPESPSRMPGSLLPLNRHLQAAGLRGVPQRVGSSGSHGGRCPGSLLLMWKATRLLPTLPLSSPS